MHLIGDVDGRAARGKVGGRAQVDGLTPSWRGLEITSRGAQYAVRRVIEFDAGEHVFMAYPATRISIGLFHQLLDRMQTVTDYMGRHALGHCDQLIIDHQHPIVGPGDIVFDEYDMAVLPRPLECEFHLLRRRELDRYAPSMIAVEGFDDNRIAELFGAHDRIAGAIDLALAWHRQAGVPQRPVRLFLVRGNVDCELTRLAGERGFDPLLKAPIAKSYRAVRVHPRTRNRPIRRGFHQCRRARPHLATARITAKIVELLFEVELRLGIRLRFQLGRQEMLDQR